MRARDIMTKAVVSVAPETPVADIARLLVEHRISGLPVVDKDEQLLGLVSEGDLLRRPETGAARRRSWWLELVADPGALAHDYVKTHGRHAQDVMTRRVIAIAEDTPVDEIADLLERRQIKRVPVVRDGRLVGIVSRADIVRALAESKPAPATEQQPDDRTIREAVLARLDSQPWGETLFVNVTVQNGVVALGGLVSSGEERVALRVVAENVPGVRRVDDNLTVRSVASYA